MSQLISQTFKNLSVDEEITCQIPKHLTPLEVIASASVIAKELAGNDEPDRHTYLAAVPRYISSLPDSMEAAVATTKQDAARVLGIPGIASDAAQLSEAQERLAVAQAEVDSAEAIQGKRLASIHRFEKEIADATNDLEAWDINFDSEIQEAENDIMQYWGKHNVQGRLDDLNRIPILRKLQPIALKSINKRITEAKAELVKLHAPV